MTSYSTDVYVKSFTHLQGKPNSDRALPLLQRIASLVKPIMRKHGWVLPVLAEFFPDNSNLLGMNVNHGEKILIRLRPAWAPDTFYDEQDLIGTMLHELTHNIHGPHDDKFYKFLSSLEDEYTTLQRNGYAGEGFHSKGQRLGANVSHDLPPHLARLKALEAAERRRRLGGLMSGGRKLGGGTSPQPMTPREMAALAAERRAQDEKACGSRSAAHTQQEADKAAKESVEDKVIDLISASDVPIRHQAGPSISSLPSSEAEWSCPTCTLLNPALTLQCRACLSNRPGDGWSCMVCGESGMPLEFSCCTFCGVKRDSNSSVVG